MSKVEKIEDGTYCMEFNGKTLYIHPEDVSTAIANNQRHFGHQDWRRPDVKEMQEIIENLNKGTFDDKLSNSFNREAEYLTNKEDLYQVLQMASTGTFQMVSPSIITFTVNAIDGYAGYIEDIFDIEDKRAYFGTQLAVRPVRSPAAK